MLRHPFHNARTGKLVSKPFLTPEYIQRHAEVLEESGVSTI